MLLVVLWRYWIQI